MDVRNYTTPLSIALAWRGMKRGLGTALLLALMTSSAYAVLPDPVGKLIAHYGIGEAALSAVVVPLDGAKPILTHRSATPRNPASVMKLLTTFAALDILGPAHTWQTRYFINGRLHDGILDGDLVIKGGGDPYLVKEQFWLQLAELRALGIETIKGNLLIDNTSFDLPPYDRSEFDQQPTRLYNVGPSATLVNFNASRFRIHPVDGKIDVLLDPPIPNIVINNQLKAASGTCRGARSGWTADFKQKKSTAYVVLTGRYRTRCGNYDFSRVALDSEAYLYGLFVYLWRNLGGRFEGGYALTEVREDAEAIYTGESRPLAEVIAGTNKYSNNLLARQLLLAIGYHYFGEGTTVKDSVQVVQTWAHDKGMLMPELLMENGAGLSRQISISANSLVELLLFASNSAYHPEFLASFSLSGMDGTMKKRLEKFALGGRARLKTGYIKGVRSLAGYVRTDSGKDYAVVLFIADKKVNFSNGNAIQDAFIKWVLRQD